MIDQCGGIAISLALEYIIYFLESKSQYTIILLLLNDCIYADAVYVPETALLIISVWLVISFAIILHEAAILMIFLFESV